jgi:hypothetical protein
MSEHDSQQPEDGFLVPLRLVELYGEQLASDARFLASLARDRQLTRRMRIRRRINIIRGNTARIAYRIIAGYDVPEKEW